MTARILRFPSDTDLVEEAARMLLNHLVQRQEHQAQVHLCLTGGRIANRIYAAFAELAGETGFDAATLHLWWGDEQFVGTTDPDRNALQSLALLARSLQLKSAQIHPMPASDGNADPDESAFTYAQELGDTVFDLCLLGMGPDGHVASIFPDHPSSDPTTLSVIGVTDAPKPPAERISLTLSTISRSRSVWLWVNGSEKAEAVAHALAGDERVPAAHASGVESTIWFLDAEAARLLPRHRCEL
ncbi:MAG: 6-phosphogluconolactonase [Propionibacterium sp.]|nr:6-phosphogluconolactonase [Propionibacterium sp.]